MHRINYIVDKVRQNKDPILQHYSFKSQLSTTHRINPTVYFAINLHKKIELQTVKKKILQNLNSQSKRNHKKKILQKF